ncbi:hypothetical protein BH23VER1_BH23VER1_24300 [soil metagenome]
MHCGAEAVTRAEISATRTPTASRSWFPLPHRSLIYEVFGQLD